jgi:lysozyme
LIKYPRAFGGLVGVLALAASLLMPFEGKHLVAYLDPPGIPTICWGHTKGVKLGQVANDAQCVEYLKEDLAVADGAVSRLVTVPLADETRAALISFTLNTGQGNLARSTLLRKLNAGDIVGACNELSKWVYARGVKLRGLVLRRAAEREMCMKGAAS